MGSKTLQKQKKLSDSEQTIVDIRKFRWEESKKIKTFEDVQSYEREVDDEMQVLRLKYKKSF